MNESEPTYSGKDIAARRKAVFGTKSAAYSKAGVNAATWDRAEKGLNVREDRMIAIVNALWPEADDESPPNTGSPEDWHEWPDLETPLAFSESENDRIMYWVAQNFVRINQRLAELGEAIETLTTRKAGTEDVATSAEKRTSGQRQTAKVVKSTRRVGDRRESPKDHR